jgi:hypothetical protein
MLVGYALVKGRIAAGQKVTLEGARAGLRESSSAHAVSICRESADEGSLDEHLLISVRP